MLTAEVELAGERLVLSPYRALFWPRMRWLLLSDAHLGKAAHFRKAGLPLPDVHDDLLLDRLGWLIQEYGADRVVVLGDLFHSAYNSSWDLFTLWMERVPCEMHLVLGNHDVLADRRYLDAGLKLHDEVLLEGPFALTHEPRSVKDRYVLSGHLHPGIHLTGQGRQHLRLPCFWFGQDRAVLPAFGTATGLHAIAPAPGDRCFAVTERSVLDVSGVEGGQRAHRGRRSS
ncbi:MAG: ligase-associated DNA damage response endonuclease PdeM [Flavobacteriales bacterium]|nr:ligase-associated DNA damage response endonuclease PdeM [Flavobacteriales bacterium]